MAITASTIIQTKYGAYRVSWHQFEDGYCVSFAHGNVELENPILRIHSACLFGEAFHSLHCDCDHQLTQTMEVIQKAGAGIIVYQYEEGRGIGLENKLRSMEIERTEGCDTVEAFKKLGFEKPDLRVYHRETAALHELKVNKNIISFSGNPEKQNALEKAGFIITKTMEIRKEGLSEIAIKEKQVKHSKMGYQYKNHLT